MKKKIVMLIVSLFVITCLCDLTQINIAKASETNTGATPGAVSVPLSNISIKQNPSKTTYYQGENLDLSDMILEGSYTDGTTALIKDYTVTGYDSNLIGLQTVTISYQGFAVTIGVTVIPAKVVNIAETTYSTSNFTLTWNMVPGAVRYEIYGFDSASATFKLITTSDVNTVTLAYPQATSIGIQICAVEYSNGLEVRGGFSDTFVAATAPDIVTGLAVKGTSASSVSLSWNGVPGAAGYIIYRSKGGDNKFSYSKTTTTNNYTDKDVSSGTGYQYKVCAYTFSKQYFGVASQVVDLSTNPAKMVLKCKAGEQKIRISWAKITGASTYELYMGDDISGYTLVTTRKASSTCSYVIDGLTLGNSYTIYAVAKRKYNGMIYESKPSEYATIKIDAIAPTSTEAKIFETEEDFEQSLSFTTIGFFQENVAYTKSYIIPGLIATNSGGFISTDMCPQGITFAKNYLLQTAYDILGEENSVIYVINKSSKKLVTTLVLPSKAHLGGIAFDGMNIWVTRGTSVSSISMSQIDTAVAAATEYFNVKFNSSVTVGITASYLTFYNDKLWVGSYDELKNTEIFSYTVENKDTEPILTKVDTMIMPNRVQGVAFTSKGEMILSRSCQLYQGLRGYIRQLDVYKPNFTKVQNGIVPMGDIVNTVEMPSMNEGLAIDGSYLYVVYESAAFDKATYQMDRICAFKLTKITKKPSKEKK